MDILTKVIHQFPLSQISELYIDGMPERFCYILEDAARPKKIKEWTAIPRTGMATYYSIGIRYSPAFDREMLVIYNQPDKETLRLQGMEFKYCMFHGGNDFTHTEGCPLTAFNLIDKRSRLEYNGKVIEYPEKVVQGTAEVELFNIVAPRVRADESVRLFML
jgi:hypothetical protein